MNIWLVTIGEPVPDSVDFRGRLHRTGQFALSSSKDAGIEWWTSSFDHFKKKFLFEGDEVVRLGDNLVLSAFKGCGYRSNLSLARLRDQRLLAKKMYAAMKQETAHPDIILCSLPPVEIAEAAVRYGREAGFPVVLDLRDMWPDIFVDHAPSVLRPLARLVLKPMFRQAEKVCREADALIGITDSFLDWGLGKAGRKKRDWDKAFPFAYNPNPPDAEKLAEADRFWDSLGVLKKDNPFTVCFFGSINRQFDFKTVFDAFRVVGDKARLIVCGSGDKFAYVKGLAKGQNNILFPGWVDAPRIYSLMRRSNAGLDPLSDRYDFLASINNKAVEYLSTGLPIISSPCRGELFNLLQKYQGGVSFNPGDSAALAGIISRLAAAPLEVTRMAEGAAKCFEENFVAEKVHSEMFSHLQLIVDEFKRKA